ncbi:ribonuclease H-like YkuK family protein [Candidatus Gottesmanbacteria bacterium]|nr:ribonuclease H-like YkuK family protein [Candidatus Gottesmanbacteria bacterium]
MKPDRARNAQDSKPETKRIKITQPRKGLGFCKAPDLFRPPLFATMSLSMFQSPTFGEVELPGVRTHIIDFLSKDPASVYQIIVGTDSQPHNGSGVDFVTAIVVHRVGNGGIYFWKRLVNKKPYVLRQRMYEEATMSLAMAEEVVELLRDDGITKYDIEIHVDIGASGPTREMISEIIGMIRGSGFPVKMKPDSYAASKVADRYT